MMITMVADRLLPAYGDCSRDPQVLARGLSDLGHHVIGPVFIDPRAAGPGDPTGLNKLLDPWLAETPDVVVALGLASPVAAAALAQTRRVPLVLGLPADLLLPSSTLPIGYGRVLCGSLPATCLIVESDRQRIAAEQLGAPPQSVFVVPPGLALPDLASAPTVQPGPLRILHDIGAGTAADGAFVLEVVDRLRARWSDAGGRDVAVVTESTASVAAHLSSDLVIITDQSSQGTVVAMRAMAASRPMLAADGPAIQDVVASVRHGVLARPGETEEWVDKLEYLLADPALRAHLGRGARIRMETVLALPQVLEAFDKRLIAVTSAWNYRVTTPDRL